MSIADLVAKSGLSVKGFANWLGIPYRTVQDWYYGNRTPPKYVVSLIRYRIEH